MPGKSLTPNYHCWSPIKWNRVPQLPLPLISAQIDKTRQWQKKENEPVVVRSESLTTDPISARRKWTNELMVINGY